MSEQHLAEIKCLKNRVFSSFLTARSKERENERFGFFSALQDLAFTSFKILYLLIYDSKHHHS